jgi:hypothetical protein
MVTIEAEVHTTNGKPYSVIGRRVLRPDGVDKVTGRAQYGAEKMIQIKINK